MPKAKERLSNIELLKIIAIMIIAISHSVPYYGDASLPSFIDLNCATNSIQNYILVLFRCLGQLGNCIFVVCSAYFLVDSKKIKFSKIMYIVADTFLFSVTFLFFIKLLGFNIKTTDFIKQFFPITFQLNWFIGCYLSLYLIHSGLNLIIKSITQKQFFCVTAITAIMFIVYSFIKVIQGEADYTNQVVKFIVIYIITSYMKLYMTDFTKNIKLNLIICILSILLYMLSVACINILGLHISFFANKILCFCDFMNPFIILISVTLFNIFGKFNLKNKTVNLISSVSLLIYITHENILFRRNIKPLFWLYVYNTFSYKYVALWVLLFSAVCFIGSTIIAIAYKKTLQKYVYKLCDFIKVHLKPHCEKALDYLTSYK